MAFILVMLGLSAITQEKRQRDFRVVRDYHLTLIH